MSWQEEAIELLTRLPAWGYAADPQPAAEPTALAVCALEAWGRPEAERGRQWLAQLQAADGSVGVRVSAPQPKWPTALAVLAWDGQPDYRRQQIQAVRWILSARGEPLKQSPRNRPLFGHDTSLIAWPWVQGTHSWLEPTCYHVFALAAAGHAQHPRRREALRLIDNRLLPEGGCNYGNTTVLGQTLRPHPQPSGMAAAALRGEVSESGRLAPTLDYLRRSLPRTRAAVSLTWLVFGLRAHQAAPPTASDCLANVARRLIRRGGDAYRLSLLLLAASERGWPAADLTPVSPSKEQTP